MINLELEKKKLVDEIENKGYKSLRYSIFNEHRPLEWEVRIEFDDCKHLYLVYATMDRASKGGDFQYLNFEEAKNKFIELLDHVVLRNKYYIDNDWPTQYSSPLWDNTDD
ncbi:Imm59 family immunity protein [Streptococcus fryi]